MNVVVGGGLLAGGLLIITILTALFHRKRGPRWLNADVTAMLLCIPPAIMVGVGAAFTLAGLAGDHRPVDLAALVAWLAIGFGLIWMQRRRRAALVETASEVGSGVQPFEPRPPRDPGPGGRPRGN
jgi:hypothetical protein